MSSTPPPRIRRTRIPISSSPPGEYNAYAAAWKAGQTWTNAPNSAPNPIPIPANYVTRAGYLMTNGGAYYNDGSARPTNWKTNAVP